jgi:hypothetical protein
MRWPSASAPVSDRTKSSPPYISAGCPRRHNQWQRRLRHHTTHRELSLHAFDNSPRFSMAVPGKDLPQRWSWRLEIAPPRGVTEQEKNDSEWRRERISLYRAQRTITRRRTNAATTGCGCQCL